MRTAWRDVLAGTASAFQFHVLSLALVSEKRLNIVGDWAVIFGLRSPNNRGIN
jgi:hypothetical protein